MNFDENDIHNLALVAWKEARGEGMLGCVAVMNVVKNRVGTPGFAHNLHDVIYGKNQFTSMSVPTDSQFNLSPPPGDSLFTMLLTIANQVLSGDFQDNTNGAHYYANLKTATSGWFFNHIVKDTVNHPQTAIIGHHTFYK